jgi:hypothetical protein
VLLFPDDDSLNQERGYDHREGDDAEASELVTGPLSE